MFFVHAIILAVVEGITEFLPVSSTAHLLLLEAWVSLGDDEAFRRLFEVLIQFPAILAVVVYFRRDLVPFGAEGAKRAEAGTLWAKALLAVVPVGVLGVFANGLVDAHLWTSGPTAVSLVRGGRGAGGAGVWGGWALGWGGGGGSECGSRGGSGRRGL